MAMTEDEARAFLWTIHTPQLDSFRDNVPTMATSLLLAYGTNPQTLIDHFKRNGTRTDDDFRFVLAAAAFAINDEIDRRIPVPK